MVASLILNVPVDQLAGNDNGPSLVLLWTLPGGLALDQARGKPPLLSTMRPRLIKLRFCSSGACTDKLANLSPRTDGGHSIDEVLRSTFTAHAVYYYLVQNWGNVAALDAVVW